MAEQGQEILQPLEPRIQFSEGIKSPDCPYKIDLDMQGVSELLKIAGIDEEDIPDITINIKKVQPRSEKRTHGREFGFYEKDTITLYTDNIYNEFPIVQKAWQILEQRGELKADAQNNGGGNSFPELTSGKRLTAYLQTIPKERGIEMAKKLKAIRAGKMADVSLAHEARHAGNDYSDEPMQAAARKPLSNQISNNSESVMGTLLTTQDEDGTIIDKKTMLARISGLPVVRGIKSLAHKVNYFYFDTEEKSARAFEEQMGNNPQYRVITFTPR